MSQLPPVRAAAAVLPAEPLSTCGAADDRGYPIRCEQCIWGDTCLDSTCRPEPEEVTAHACCR